MEDRGQLRTEEHDQARHIAPGQHRDDSADRAVDLIVVEIAETRRKTILRDFPQQPREKRARQSVSQRHRRLRHEAIDKHHQDDGDEITDDCEQHLPKRAAD